MEPYYLPLDYRANITILTTEVKICEQTSTELEAYITGRARSTIRTPDSLQPRCLMTHHSLYPLTVTVPNRFSFVNYNPLFLLFILCKINIPRFPTLNQWFWFGCLRSGNYALTSNPTQCDLRQGTAFKFSELFDFLYNCFVFVEIIALEFGYCDMNLLATNLKC